MNNNTLTLKGYVVGKPVLTENTGKMPYAKYGLSVQSGRKNSEGNFETFLVDITAFGTEAYFADEHLDKGTRICVTGVLSNTPKNDGTPRKNPQLLVDREGQSIRPKTSRFYSNSKQRNTELTGDAHEFDNYQEDITPIDDSDMPF